MKKISARVLFILLFVFILSLSACGGGSNIIGTWVPSDAEAEGAFESVTFDGDTISIPGITMSAMEMMGVSYTYKIADDKLTISSTGGGVSMEALSLSYKKDGDSIFLDDIEYVKEQ